MIFQNNWGMLPLGNRPRVVFTIGMFDGLHRGHRHLIELTVKRAAELKAQSLVLTFDPHPLEILAKNAAPPVLSTLEQKAPILESFGIDILGVLNFTAETAALTPYEFLEKMIDKIIDPVGAVIGPDFTFGQGAAGDASTIRQWLRTQCPHAQVIIANQKIGLASRIYSSSQIRQDLKHGLVENAAEALGWPYRLSGTVTHGLARGRLLGFPTANLGDIKQLIPEAGVYAVRALVGETLRPAMTSIGYNPTFGEQPMTVETNIFDFNQDIYGQIMAIDFIGRLRPMIRFNSPEELVRQLELDERSARNFLNVA